MHRDDLLSLMAAVIYAARLRGYYASIKTADEWRANRSLAMKASVQEAQELFEAVFGRDVDRGGN